MQPVLIVDDDEDIRELIALVLRDEGYAVLTVADGAAALASIAQQPPRLILLDLLMPVMGGLEFVRHYRETPGPHAPVVMLSAAPETGERALEAHADDYLAKPFEIEDLLAMVKKYAGAGH